MKRINTCKVKKITAIVLTVILALSAADMAKLYSRAEEPTQNTEGEGNTGTGGNTEGTGDSTGDSGTGTEGNAGTEENSTSENTDENSTEGESSENQRESFVRPDRSNEDNIFYFLTEQMNLNEAAACGVLANIKAESSFSPKAMGDKVGDTFTSFGICQWHNNRWNSLKIFCATMELEEDSLEGQLLYLQYELEHNYRHVLNALKQVSNTPEGAYDAGYVFCYRFEIPANKEVKSDYRGCMARDTYWPRHGGYVNGNQFYIWKTVGDKSYWYENGVRQGTYEDKAGVVGDGTIRGREIYDPLSNGWYWLDAVYGGAKATNKEVWMPYVYNGEEKFDEDTIAAKAAASGEMADQVKKAIKAHGGENAGKWVRYDKQGKMIKGWYTVQGADAELYPDQVGNTYYYDIITGLMAKGDICIDNTWYHFNEWSGALEN